MDVVYSKIAALTLLAVLTLVFGLIPARLYRLLKDDEPADREDYEARDRRKNKQRLANTIIAGLLQFGGGVLICTCFLHMLPEVRENFLKAARNGDTFLSQSKFPYSELCICLGFFVVYSIDQLVQICSDTDTVANQGESVASSAEDEGHMPLAHSWRKPADKIHPPTADTALYSDLGQTKGLECNSNSVPAQVEHANSSASIEGAASCKQLTIVKYGSMEYVSTGENPTASSIRNVLRGSLIIIALSLHSVFEGMAIGLQPTSPDVWTLFAAVAIHKGVIAFCVGLELMTMGMSFKRLLFNMLTLALVSPIGVGMGIAITVMSSGGATSVHVIVVGAFQGLAAGTLFFVTFFEVLGKELREKNRRIFKLSCLLLGFALMASTLSFEL